MLPRQAWGRVRVGARSVRGPHGWEHRHRGHLGCGASSGSWGPRASYALGPRSADLSNGHTRALTPHPNSRCSLCVSVLSTCCIQSAPLSTATARSSHLSEKRLAGGDRYHGQETRRGCDRHSRYPARWAQAQEGSGPHRSPEKSTPTALGSARETPRRRRPTRPAAGAAEPASDPRQPRQRAHNQPPCRRQLCPHQPGHPVKGLYLLRA